MKTLITLTLAFLLALPTYSIPRKIKESAAGGCWVTKDYMKRRNLMK